MKQGRTFSNVVNTILQDSLTKRDFRASTQAATMYVDDLNGTRLELRGKQTEDFGIRPYAHTQIADKTGIPKVYYDRLLEKDRPLLCQNVNSWFENEPAERLVRTTAGNVRGWLSDRYRPLDNDDLMTAIVPKITASGIVIESCEVTETVLYLKAVSERLTLEPVPGDPVQIGIMIRNSEVGHSALSIQTLLYRLVCKNGLVLATTMRKAHLGRRTERAELFDPVYLTDSTHRLNDAAFWSSVNDTVDFVLSEVNFQAMAKRVEEKAEMKIERHVPEVVEVVASRMGFSQITKQLVLENLINGGDRTAWGVVNAVTAASQSIEDYEAATDLEEAGGKLIELSPRDWGRIIVEADQLAEA